jgi:hypothetical protein
MPHGAGEIDWGNGWRIGPMMDDGDNYIEPDAGIFQTITKNNRHESMPIHF